MHEQQSHILTRRAQNVSFPLSPLLPRGKHSVNIPLSCSVGDYKSKLQLYRDRRGHPGNPQPSLAPSVPLPPSVPSDFSLPLASSLYCTNASRHRWSHLGVVCDLPLLVSPCKDRGDTVHANQQHGIRPTSDTGNTGNMRLHVVSRVLSSPE